MFEEDVVADSKPTPEEQAKIDALSDAEIEEIDRVLLSNITHRWRKVAMVVGVTMMNQSNRIHGIPDVFYASRVRGFVESGLVDSDGDLQCMRSSEVRLVIAANENKLNR